MSNLKSNSSRNSSRAPFEPVTKLEQVPVAFYEILSLASEIEGEQARTIESLTRSIIRTTQTGRLADLAELPHVATNQG